MFTKTRMAFLTIGILLTLLLSACEGGQVQDGTPAPDGTPVIENGEGIPPTGNDETATPEIDLTPTVEGPAIVDTPAAETTPTSAMTTGEDTYRDYGQVPVTSGQRAPQTRAAQIMPETGRSEIVLLSNWMDLVVIDSAGNRIGTVHDYVLNTCEAHIIYVAIQLDGEGETGRNVVLMPYEVVTLGGGILDVDERVIVVAISADEFRNAPFISVDDDITDVTWETETRDYWSGYVTMSDLSTECMAVLTGQGNRNQNNNANTNDNENSNLNDNDNENANLNDNDNDNNNQSARAGDRTAVVKIDYASNILQARIQDGNGQAIGVVEDVTLFPESGLLRFLIVDMNADGQQGYVLIPFGAVNIELQEAADDTVLVLLVERQILMNAPTFEQLPDTTQDNWDSDSFEFWSQHVPMTREDMP
jgi:sporulation protein YlmC with PRC-barrel domain